MRCCRFWRRRQIPNCASDCLAWRRTHTVLAHTTHRALHSCERHISQNLQHLKHGCRMKRRKRNSRSRRATVKQKLRGSKGYRRVSCLGTWNSSHFRAPSFPSAGVALCQEVQRRLGPNSEVTKKMYNSFVAEVLNTTVVKQAVVCRGFVHLC